jgi:predicted metal-dependent hydrolase
MRSYLLSVTQADEPAAVEISHNRIYLRVRPGTNRERKEAILERWYREQVKSAAPLLIKKWERLMAVKVQRFFVQHMKTKWGSCNHRSATIRLNTELAKKPKVCLEYILVHEMAHLIEPTHNARFIAVLECFLPKWQSYRDELNRLPVRHESWLY